MAIYPPQPDPFPCSICGDTTPRSVWRWKDTMTRPPLCWRCEQDWGVGQYGDLNPDRRVIKQISALTEALRVDSYRIERGEAPIYG